MLVAFELSHGLVPLSVSVLMSQNDQLVSGEGEHHAESFSVVRACEFTQLLWPKHAATSSRVNFSSPCIF